MKKLDLWRRRAPHPSAPPAAGGCDAAEPSRIAVPASPAVDAERTPVDDDEDTVPAAFYHQPD